jgi:small subunit ribosomal protein S16
MLTIRLQRAGKKNKPEYRLVLAEKTSAAQKKFTEILGNYNPHSKVLAIRDQARLDYWIKEQHVEVSPTAYNLLVTNKLVEGKKVKAFTLPKKEVVAETEPALEATAEAPAEEITPSETTEEAPPVEPQA